MKYGLVFTLTTGGLSILLLLIAAPFIDNLKGEVLSYMLLFFMMCTVIGIMIFPFAVPLVRPLSIDRFWKAMIYLALGLLILNFPGDAQNNHWVTIDTIRDFFHPEAGAAPEFPYTLGVFHLAPLLAGVLSMLFFRKQLFEPLPEPPAQP